MASTIPQAFAEFERKLALTPYQDKAVKERRLRTQAILKELFPETSNMTLIGAYLIGSAAHSTLIRPITDIDVLAFFGDGIVWPYYKDDSRKLLYRVREALNKQYKTTVVGARGQAVRLGFTQAPSVDIAPAFRWGPGSNSYVIPAGNGQWIMTAPFQHTEFLSQRNKALNSQLKPLTRILKRWNAVHSARIGSFHLELIVQATFRTIGTSRADALMRFFEWAPNHLDQNDPAGHSGNLAASWTPFQRLGVVGALKSSYDRARRALLAQAQSNNAEASRLWRLILGDEFPSLL